MKAEIERRRSLADQLEDYLKARPGQWLTMQELAAVGGLGGWRTRISDLRLKRDMRIDWNGQSGSASRHCYIPAASQPSPDRWTIPGAPYGPAPFELTPPEAR